MLWVVLMVAVVAVWQRCDSEQGRDRGRKKKEGKDQKTGGRKKKKANG